MMRAKGEGCIRKRASDGLWEGIYTVGRNEKGKLVRRSIYGKTKKEVALKLGSITNDLHTGIYISPDSITVGQWLDIWLSEYLGDVKRSTLAQYGYQVRVHIKPCLGPVILQKLSAPMIQKMYNDKLKAGLSPKSIKNLHGVLHKALQQAVLCQYLKINPTLACKLPRVEKKEMHPLHDQYVSMFLDEIKGKPYADLFLVDIFTGLREGEIIGLTWDNVDFSKGVIRVEKQLKRERQINGGNEYKFGPLKNDKTRTIIPAPVVFSVLRNVKKRQAENRMKYGTSYENPDNLVFTNELGGHLSPVSLLGCFKRRVKAIGVPETRFHDLRHTYATLSLQNGVDIKTVSANLGHATVAFTLDVYGHVTDKMMQESAARMQAYYESLSS